MRQVAPGCPPPGPAAALARGLTRLNRDGWITATRAAAMPDAWHTRKADPEAGKPREKVTRHPDPPVAGEGE